MLIKSRPKIALLGNPNSGKSSLFNHLTGLNQKIGNFPGVTVEKKTGTCKINDQVAAEIIDLPGTYSLYPKSYDEQIVFDFLNDPNDPFYPDLLLVVVDVSIAVGQFEEITVLANFFQYKQLIECVGKDGH